MSVLAGYKASLYVSGGASTPLSPIAMTDQGDHKTFKISNTLHRYLDPGVPVTVQTSPDGSTWTTVTTGFTVQYCGGVVTFASAVTGATPSCQLLNGAWFAFSQAMQAKSVEIQPVMDIADITTFASAQANNRFKSKLPLTSGNTWKIGQWHLDGTYLALLRQLMLVSAYTGANINQRIESYAYIKTDAIKFDIKGVNEETLDFEAHGPIYTITS